MFMLLSISFIQHNSGQFLASNIVDRQDYALISAVEGILCAVLRIDAVNLVEAWKFSDVRLDSTLGNNVMRCFVYPGILLCHSLMTVKTLSNDT